MKLKLEGIYCCTFTNGVQLKKKNQHLITFGVSYLINFVAGILQDHYIKYEKEEYTWERKERPARTKSDKKSRYFRSKEDPQHCTWRDGSFLTYKVYEVIMSWNDCKLDSLTYHRNRRSVVTSKPPLEYYIGKKSESLFDPGEHSGKYTGEADLYKALWWPIMFSILRRCENSNKDSIQWGKTGWRCIDYIMWKYFSISHSKTLISLKGRRNWMNAGINLNSLTLKISIFSLARIKISGRY